MINCSCLKVHFDSLIVLQWFNWSISKYEDIMTKNLNKLCSITLDFGSCRIKSAQVVIWFFCKKHLASRFNLTYRYIDDVLSINNPEFEHYLGQMYPAELEIKDTTESTTSASNLDLLLSIGRDGQLHTSIYDKRDDFNFHITNFPFLSSNIPSSPACGDLSLNLYDTPGLAPRMNVFFWGPGDFPVSYSNKDTSRNAWNRHSGSFMVDTGILFSNMK